MKHVLEDAVQISYPGGKDGMWTRTCSCGTYRSPLASTAEATLKPAREHVAAKEALHKRRGETEDQA